MATIAAVAAVIAALGAVAAAVFTAIYAWTTHQALQQDKVAYDSQAQAAAAGLDTAEEDARQLRNLSVLTEVLREWRTEDFQKHRRFVEALDMSKYDAHAADNTFPTRAWISVGAVNRFYDNVGMLLFHKLVDVLPILDYMGSPALVAWSRLEEFNLAQRSKRANRAIPAYMGHFNFFAELAARGCEPAGGCAGGAALGRGLGHRLDPSAAGRQALTQLPCCLWSPPCHGMRVRRSSYPTLICLPGQIPSTSTPKPSTSTRTSENQHAAPCNHHAQA